MPEWEVIDFETEYGAFPVRAFIESLDQEKKAAAFALVQLLRERGNMLRRPHSGQLGEDLFELRDLHTGVRIFFTFLPGKRAVLLDGMVKKRDKIPPAELREARRYCKEARSQRRK